MGTARACAGAHSARIREAIVSDYDDDEFDDLDESDPQLVWFEEERSRLELALPPDRGPRWIGDIAKELLADREAFEKHLDRLEMRDRMQGLYESPIERDAGYLLWKRLAEEASIKAQRWVRTPSRSCRLDFEITIGATHVAIECDGRQFHNRRDDLERDRDLLTNEKVDRIYRLSGATIWQSLGEALYLIASVDPELFSPRGRYLLHVEFGRYLVDGKIYRNLDSIVGWFLDREDDPPRDVHVTRRTRESIAKLVLR